MTLSNILDSNRISGTAGERNNRVFGWGSDPPVGRGNFWGLSAPMKSIGSLWSDVR